MNSATPVTPASCPDKSLWKRCSLKALFPCGNPHIASMWETMSDGEVVYNVLLPCCNSDEQCVNHGLLVLTGRFSGRETRLCHHVIYQRTLFWALLLPSSTAIFLSFWGLVSCILKCVNPFFISCKNTKLFCRWPLKWPEVWQVSLLKTV